MTTCTCIIIYTCQQFYEYMLYLLSTNVYIGEVEHFKNVLEDYWTFY